MFFFLLLSAHLFSYFSSLFVFYFLPSSLFIFPRSFESHHFPFCLFLSQLFLLSKSKKEKKRIYLIPRDLPTNYMPLSTKLLCNAMQCGVPTSYHSMRISKTLNVCLWIYINWLSVVSWTGIRHQYYFFFNFSHKQKERDAIQLMFLRKYCMLLLEM